ncbi:MAG: MFS transporter, partial [Candidatus Limnocylindrales bacterium]
GAVRDNLVEGLAYVRHTPVVLMAVVVVGLVATFGMNFSVIIPPLASEILASDAAGYGFLMTASGLGALIAAVVLVAGGKPRQIRIGGGAVLLGIASLLLAISTSYPLSLLLMAPIGAGGIAMAATANATIQLAVPDGLRGRVMSVYTTAFSASIPIGGLLSGALASSVGIPMTVAIGGALSLAVGAVALVWWRRIAPRPTTAPATIGSTEPVMGPLTSGPAAVEMAAESVAGDAAFETSAGQPATQSAAPNTSAAFKPPKPKEVLSTRR